MEIIAIIFIVLVIWVALSGSSSENSSHREVTSTGRTSTGLGSARRRHRSPREAAEDSRRVWMPPGQPAAVQGRRLPDGMFYVGKSLPPVASHMDVDPALINPTLRADSQRVDRSGQHLNYWPSYSEIPRSSRAAYLDWLEAGRREPGTPAGYVFLFFYGLERRLLVDAQVSDQARGEVERLVQEIEGLLGVYGEESRSFRRYASSLLQYVRLVYGLDRSASDEWRAEPEEGPAAEWMLGRCVGQGDPIPAAWAARFARGEASGELRTPAKRCPESFYRLFELRYEEKYGEGLRVQADGPPLEISYHPASAGIRKEFTHRVRDAVAVSELSEVRSPLVQLAKSVEPEIEDYSRWIGRRGERDSPAAVGLLPQPIVAEFAGQEARDLARQIENWLGDDPRVVVPSEQVVALWPTKNHGYMTGKEAEAFSGFLEGFDLGVEPDIRYTRNPSKRDHLTIFRLSDGAGQPGEKFEGARLLLHLAAAVAGADEEITEEEERHIEAHLEEALNLKPHERARLRAHLARRLEHPPTLRGVRNRAEELSETQRHTLARFLVTVAGADGHLDHGEVKVLEKIYDTLHLDSDAVHADLHDMAARAPGDTGPVVVVEADEDEAGYEIPEHGEEASSERYSDGVTLDADRLEAVKAETRVVSHELAGVFAEEDGHAEDSAEQPVQLSANGLSEAHVTLLNLLADRPSCSRAEFDELAEQHGLIPGFAIEQINSASLEECGEPLLEGDDPVEVNVFALEEFQG